MRLEAVMQAHPGWQGIRRIDALLAQAGAPVAASPAAFPLGEATPPPPLRLQPGPRGRLAPASAQIMRPALHRMDALQESMEARDRRLWLREARNARRDLEESLATYRAQLAVALRDEEQQLREQYERAISPLLFERVAYGSQVLAYRFIPGSQAAMEGQRELTRIAQALDEERARLAAALVRLRSESAQQVIERRDQLEAAMERRLALSQASQSRRTAEQIAANKQAVRQDLESIGVLRAPSAALNPMPAGLSLPSARAVAAQTAATQPLPGPPTSSAAVRRLAAERQDLLSYIEQDTRRRMERIAAAQRWRVVWRPTAGTPDATEEAARLLRRDWSG